MWSASEDPSGSMEGEPPEAMVHTKEKCEQNKNQLESLKEIMMRNQQSLKKKEEEVQEYARRLSKIKSRARLSRRSKEGSSSSKDTLHSPKTESAAIDTTDDTIDDISQAKTPKAKSSLLQRKLAENRKVFEQRSKELTETKRAVEEKVEAIRQQLEETDLASAEVHRDQLPVTPVRPLMVTSDVMSPIQIQDIQEKENKIMELGNKILELEATVLDLQENLKEKDSVIDSKTKAVTLMSADLSKKGKTTLDTLEDTKDEMRIMQENFVLIETSLKNKNASLLEQLQERDNRISELEHTINRFEQQLKEQKIAESASADFSRSTMDTLAETKDAMKSMQENFVLIESSLKLKNDNLLQQLGEYEMKLAEAKERIFQLESGVGIVTAPAVEDLQFRIDKLEQSNRQLLDEKYELQKNIAEMQDQIIANRSAHDNSEKDNRIMELENLIEDLKRSNELLEAESKVEVHKHVAELSAKNEEYLDKITDLEKQVHELEAEKNKIAEKLSDERTMPQEDDKVIKLTKELDDLNKSMIKLKAQHRSKVKNLQKQLENFKMVSDTNAELVRLGNQVALLEEEKGNLQLSLVDFDELKASAGDWQERVADLENKVSSQTKEIQMHIDAIATLENQKLDLMQELHAVKQEVSALEAENAESENLRVTAEMKVVELEEQLEATHKEQSEHKLESLSAESEYNELLKKIDALTQENSELYSKLSKLEEKGASDTGSTESFEAIQVNDRNDLLKKIEDLEQKNNELTLKLTKLEEKDSSHAGSTESFETINDVDRGELLKKIEQLTQENSDLTMKLSRVEEKGSSDTGSTESFERIPEHNESTTKVELLTQENHELVIKLTKLEEQLSRMESSAQSAAPEETDDASETMMLRRENDYLLEKISKLEGQMEDLAETNGRMQSHMAELTAEKSHMVRTMESASQVEHLAERQRIPEQESLAASLPVEESVNVTSCVTDDTKSQIAALEKDNARMVAVIAQLEDHINGQKEKLSELAGEKVELSLKLERMACDDFARERLELIDKLEKLNREKESVAQERHDLHEQISTLLQKSSDEMLEVRKAEEAACQESQAALVASLEAEVENGKILVADYKNQVEEMSIKIQGMEAELQEKTRQLAEHEASGAKLESLERELREMLVTAEEWKFKYDDMQVKMRALEAGKASIEEAFRTLDGDNKELLDVIKEKDAAAGALQERLQDTIGELETRQDEFAAREREIVELRAAVESKDQELHARYAQLQNEMITIDSLQDELSNSTTKLKENEAALSISLEEVARLSAAVKQKETEIEDLKGNISEMSRAAGQSMSLAEFDEVLQSLRSTETNYAELRSKHEDVLRTNDELSRRIDDVSRRNEELKSELMLKEQEIANLSAAKEDMTAQIVEITSHKTEAEKRSWELQSILDNQTVYVERVQSDLTNEYKQMEQLKIKHTEDITMLNRRLEDVIEDLTAKIQENDALRAELEHKEELLNKNVTEEAKAALEGRLAELEQKLSESENKLQAQSEKMKKIVATFNKKKVVCQELEARVAELEEKWTTEKDEKEVKNKKIQEVENSMREKDNKIADLEERLLQARNETAEAHANSEKLAKESSSLKEKMSVLMEQIAEMGEEIERQRAEMDRLRQQIAVERMTNEDVVRQYDCYKETVNQENEQKQAILDEVKEEARELSVRMQVMETEYVEQLALIKNLQAENGLLSSKQTQINEKLENAEKESEERRALIEQLQKRIAATVSVGVQVPEENLKETESREPRCDHSEQCQNLLQALEARLQERQAEIENLNNELANSYGNIVLFHDESARYNDMMMQTAQERFNQSLMDQTSSLQLEIYSLKMEKNMSEQRLSELEAELEEYKRQSAENKVEVSEAVGEAPDSRQRDDAPQLFDASKIFGAVTPTEGSVAENNELAHLLSLLSQKAQYLSEIQLLLESMEENIEQIQRESQVGYWTNQLKDAMRSGNVDSLIAEMDKAVYLATSSQDQCYTESKRQEQLVKEKFAHVKLLDAQIQHARGEVSLGKEKVSLQDADIVALQTELTSARQAVEALTVERDQQSRVSESYKLRIDSLEAEATRQRVNDGELIRELEQRVSSATAERDLLQLQVNDLTRSLEESQEPLATQRSLQVELANVLQERDQAQALVANLTRALEDLQRSPRESKAHEEESGREVAAVEEPTESGRVSAAVEESVVHQEHVQQTQVLVEREKQETPFGVDLKWDTGSSEKLNVDEETWGWSGEDAPLAGDLGGTMTLIADTEVHLRAQVGDLQDRIKDLEAQNAKITEESKVAQLKSGKLVKKLKEYKVQVENLQQQLKTQKQADSFFDLDTAIEEELKTQIANLEKALHEIKEERKSIIAEKEALLKRLDVVVSANERYMEMKERQDMEVEVLRIQNKELSNKVQSLEWRLQENATAAEEEEEVKGGGGTASPQYEAQQTDASRHEVDTAVGQPQKRSDPESDNLEAISSKYKEEIDDLKDELEALAAENEQLQQFLEQQKATITGLESKAASNIRELTEKLDSLSNQHAQSQGALNKSKEEYDTLRKQYEQSLMDANDQVAAMRHNSELLKIEFSEKVERLESELQRALEEREALESRISILTSSEEKLSSMNVSLMEVTELLNARVQEVADLKQELQNQYVERQQAEAVLQSDMQNLTRDLDERKQELAALRQTCSDKEHELLQQRSMETVSAIVSEATQELVQKHAIEIEDKDKELNNLSEKLRTLQSALDEFTSRLRDSEITLEMQQQQIARLKQDLMEQESITESTRADADLAEEKLRAKEEEMTRRDEIHREVAAELERCLMDIQQLQSRLNATEAARTDLQECDSRIRNLEQQIQALSSEKESILLRYNQETTAYEARLEAGEQQIDALKHDLREKTEQMHHLSAELCAKENDVEGIKSAMATKDAQLDIAQQELSEKRAELERLRNEPPAQASKIIDGLPVFRMGNDDDAALQRTIDELKAQMEAKQQELEHLKYVLSQNTYPAIIQQMQDRINCLYNEKAMLEASLQETAQTLTERRDEVLLLKQRINDQNQEHVSKEEANVLSKDRRSAHDQEEIARLQNELHAKEQEINELRYVIAEKDSQLCLQASMEPQSDDFELRETVQRLTGELYGKEQEVQTLKTTIAELQGELSRLKDLERLSEESRSAIERLSSEKEQIRIEAEKFLSRELQKKEAEIGEIKQQLLEENQRLLVELRLKNNDIESLRAQLTRSQDDWSDRLQWKENELVRTSDDLAEKERRLAELSITKDTVFHNLKMQINEKEARIEELLALSAEEEKQLAELRQTLTARETEVNTLKQLLEQKVTEYELIQHALKKDVSVIEAAASKSPETVQTADDKEASSELNLALYMLHQRDVRCEELTHELMQLLEERDTLQLRLSNAIRVNEELRRTSSVEASPTKDATTPVPLKIVEPVVEQPSPSKSEGPVEIAKEAIDDPIEDKETLALKLSQLHSVSHTKDVRLKDERELRHTQQMSLLAHRDVLSTLPPEAAARLVNANYTLSRDVRSQSSVLLNWLWGKSTPKVVHM